MADGTERPSKWIPVANEVDLAHLGKLGEELGELSAIVSRCIIQGIDGADPETGKPNLLALQEEIADVRAMSQLAIERFNLAEGEIVFRAQRKVAMKRTWHAMLKDNRQ